MRALTTIGTILLLATNVAADGMQGAVEVRFHLSDGRVEEMRFEGLREEFNYYVSDEPQLLCEPPLARRLEANLYYESAAMPFIVTMQLEFDDYEYHRPFFLISNGLKSIYYAVDLRSNSTQEDIEKWLSKDKPVRDGADWVVDMKWQFQPANVFDLTDLNDLTGTKPKWVDPETGKETDIIVEMVEVDADLRFPALYLDPDTNAYIPCPAVEN